MGTALGGRAATAGGNVGQALLTGGLEAARTQQGGAGYSPLGGLLQGAATSPRLQTGFESAYNNYIMNRNIEGALPTSANPFGNPMGGDIDAYLSTANIQQPNAFLYGSGPV
jgi:hypothetical protein